MRSRLPSRLTCSLLFLTALLGVTPARADGSFPEPRHILLPADRPEQIILGTNFGLVFSEDSGASWQFSCEQQLSAYASSYLLSALPSHRIFAMTAGAGLVYSDDDSCSWTAAGGKLSEVMPYAVAGDPSNDKRVYAIGVPRADLHAGESIYASNDGGVTFGEPVFTAPKLSALLTVLVAPNQPSSLFAAMFSTPENHPILLRSGDSGEHWEVTADLVDSLGENPFELLAIDPSDQNKLYVRILGASAETLAISEDGGLSFVQSVSIPGKLRAFLKLASGTILVGGTAGTEAVGYRSKDGAQTFEPWPEAPHVHALAERNGKLYVAAENFSDGYAIAESDDEGAHLRPLAGFRDMQGVKSCVSDVCAEACSYYAGITLWPEAVCGSESGPTDGDEPGTAGKSPDANVKDQDGRNEVPREPEAGGAADDGPPDVDSAAGRPALRLSGGGCACNLVGGRPAERLTWLLVWGGVLVVGGRLRFRRAATPARSCRRPASPWRWRALPRCRSGSRGS